MDRGKGNGNFIDTIKKIKRLKLILVTVFPAGAVFLVVALILLAMDAANLLPSLTTASVAGVDTKYDDTAVVKDLEEMYEIRDYDEKLAKENELEYDSLYIDEMVVRDNYISNPFYSEQMNLDNHYFQELKRQRYIWTDDYSQFGITHNPASPYLVIDDFMSNDLDLVEYIIPVHYQGAVNIVSHGQNFDDEVDEIEIDNDGTKLNEYEGEKIVYNRDTRDFYNIALERLGTTFFVFPGNRLMVGNTISMKQTFEPIKPVYKINKSCDVAVLNMPLILSDWNVIGKMSLENEEKYLEYLDAEIKGPYTDATYMAKMLGAGYDKCYGPDASFDKTDWNWLNACNDYKLLYDGNAASEGEIEYFSEEMNRIDTTDEIQTTINNAVSETSELKNAILPKWETNKEGKLVDQNIIDYKFINSFKLPDGTCQEVTVRHPSLTLITTTIDRYYNEELYETYMKELYIPYVFIDCEGCNKDKSVDSIVFEMNQLEQAYRFYNGEGYISLDGITDGGSSIIEGSNFQCGSNPVSVSDEYCSDGNCRPHNAADVTTSVKHPNVRPILAGTVYSANSSCSNSPTCSVSDALKYIAGTPLSSLSAACQCGGGLGNNVVIESVYNGKTYYTVYAHLSSVKVKTGDQVTTDTIIGTMGTTGVSTGDHLHIEMHEGDRWNPKFSPIKLFPRNQVGNTVCNDKVEDTDEKEV